MAKLSVLDMVQDILNDMDSDPVNSISDTEEALQVAQILKTTYFALIARRNWPHLKTITQLEASGDADLPTKMKVPDKIKEVEYIAYNKRQSSDNRDKFRGVDFCDPIKFLEILNARDDSQDNITQVSDYGTSLNIRNDHAPRYWTSFDDDYVYFDAWDSDVETTLQQNKTQMTCWRSPEWTQEDTFVPDLPEEAFIGLLEEAKSRSFVKLKQTTDPTAAAESKRQQAWLSRKEWRAHGGLKRPDYGRGTKKASDPTFNQG